MTALTTSFWKPARPVLLLPPLEVVEPALALRDLIDVLGGAVRLSSRQTSSYRIRGTDTLTWGNPIVWSGIRATQYALSAPKNETGEAATLAATSIALLETVEQDLNRQSQIEHYMKQIENWAEAYDREAIVLSDAQLDDLYDATFFDVIKDEH